MPLAAFDGEAGGTGAGVESLERVDPMVDQRPMDSSNAEVAEASMPEIGEDGCIGRVSGEKG
jgi:hypothetical protein